MKKVSLFLMVAFIVVSFLAPVWAKELSAVEKSVMFKDNKYTFTLYKDYETLDLSVSGYFANISAKQLGCRVVDFWPQVCPFGVVVVWKIMANDYNTYNYRAAFIYYLKGKICMEDYLLTGKGDVENVKIAPEGDKGAKFILMYKGGGSKDFDLTFKTNFKELY